MKNWMQVRVISCEPPILKVRENVSGAVLTIRIGSKQRLTLEVPLNGKVEAFPLRRLSLREFEELIGIWTVHRMDGSSEILRSKNTQEKVETKEQVCPICYFSTEQPAAMAEHMAATGHGLPPAVRNPKEGIEFVSR
jgi:hypothetical protein